MIRVRENSDLKGTDGVKGLAVAHHELSRALVEQADRRCMSLSNMQAQLSRCGKDMAVSWDVLLNPTIRIAGCCLSFGLVHSTAARFRTIAYGGVRTTKEDAGIPLTSIAFARQDQAFDLKEEAGRIIEEFQNRAKGFRYTIEGLKASHLNEDEATKTLLEASRDDLIPWSRIGLAEQWFRQGRNKSKWDLAVALSLAAQRGAPLRQMALVHSFIYDYLGV